MVRPRPHGSNASKDWRFLGLHKGTRRLRQQWQDVRLVRKQKTQSTSNLQSSKNLVETASRGLPGLIAWY